MIIHQNAFREELYLEHLEEAAFQYETRLAWLQDEEVGWQDLDDIDSALEAHIDALVVGGELALQLCVKSIPEADYSTLHAIVRVFCRCSDFKNLSNLWSELDFQDLEKTNAISDALKWECPKEWLPYLVNVFSSDRVEMYHVVAPAIGYCSPEASERIIASLQRAKPEYLSMLLTGINNCGQALTQKDLSQLSGYLEHPDTEIVNQVILTMLKADQNILQQMLSRIREFPLMFAIGGSLLHCRKLLELAKNGTADENCLLALGISGNLESVPHLLAYLKHPDLAPAAAQALQLISGASLYEDVHVEDEVEEDELFEAELEAFKKQEKPKNINGVAFGGEVKKLTIDQDVWSQWLQANKALFTQGVRYRNGKVFSATELLNNLIDNNVSFQIRNLAFQELVVRYKMRVSFHADDLVEKQKATINEIHQWIKNNQSKLMEGEW